MVPVMIAEAAEVVDEFKEKLAHECLSMDD